MALGATRAPRFIEAARAGGRAFTMVEMLVVVSIIAVLAAMLLPAIGNARNQAKLTQSLSNLRNLSVAHANYASEWNDRQFTLTRDDMSRYGTNAVSAIAGYVAARIAEGETGSERYPPPVQLGWGGRPGGTIGLINFPYTNAENYVLLEPIAFLGYTERPRFGYFRLPNARQFSQYLSGRFFDPVFFAPKDRVVMEMFDEVVGLPYEFPKFTLLRDELGWSDRDMCYSSYSLSPAALFSPEVMRSPEAGGWQNPWLLNAGFRAPSMSQAEYPSLKTHMLEHHWLQGARSTCNPAMTEDRSRPYHDCQPYFFNHGIASSPAALFYDGHVDTIGVQEAQQADGRARAQAGSDDAGLWSRDTPFGNDGYFISRGYDQAANTSFHILTTDGIRGRDRVDR